jgi:hypothetical protein
VHVFDTNTTPNDCVTDWCFALLIRAVESESEGILGGVGVGRNF